MAVSGVSSSQPEPEVTEGGAVSPLLGVFLGVVGALLLLAAAAIFITRRHCSRNPGRTPDLVAGQGECGKEEGEAMRGLMKESDDYVQAR